MKKYYDNQGVEVYFTELGSFCACHNRFHSFNDQPATIIDNVVEWRLHGHQHRNNDDQLPAVIYLQDDPMFFWYHDGRPHREGGPAYIKVQGDFFCNGLSEPSWKLSKLDKQLKAIKFSSDYKIHGKQYSFKEFKQRYEFIFMKPYPANSPLEDVERTIEKYEVLLYKDWSMPLPPPLLLPNP